jgi:hypothetical protein
LKPSTTCINDIASPEATEYADEDVTKIELLNPTGAVLDRCAVALLESVELNLKRSTGYTPSFAVTLAPAFLWSITIDPFISRFLNP